MDLQSPVSTRRFLARRSATPSLQWRVRHQLAGPHHRLPFGQDVTSLISISIAVSMLWPATPLLIICANLDRLNQFAIALIALLR